MRYLHGCDAAGEPFRPAATKGRRPRRPAVPIISLRRASQALKDKRWKGEETAQISGRVAKSPRAAVDARPNPKRQRGHGTTPRHLGLG